MVRRYLEKILGQLLEDKADLEKRIVSLNNSITENEKFTQLLDETNDPNFEAFTPRAVNARNKEKIRQLQEDQKKMSEEKKGLEVQLSSVKERLAECRNVLEQEYEIEKTAITMGDVTERKLHYLEVQEAERRSIADKLEHTAVQKMQDISDKLELSLQLLEVDTHRSRMELSDVPEQIRSLMEAMNETINHLDPLRDIYRDRLQNDISKNQDPSLCENHGVGQTCDPSLDDLIKRTVKYIRETYGGDNKKISISFQKKGAVFPVKSVVASALIRILSDVSESAIRDRGADKIRVSLEYERRKEYAGTDRQEASAEFQAETGQKQTASSGQKTEEKLQNQEQQKLIFKITDNGIPAVISEGNDPEYLSDDTECNTAQQTQNLLLKQTVELLFGELDIESVDETKTVMTVKIPCSYDKKNN